MKINKNYISPFSAKFGFTLIEIMVSIAIVAIIASLAIPAYREYVREGEISKVVQEMQNISLMIDDMKLSGDLPASLNEIGVNFVDPWGNAYQYLNLWTLKNPGKSRKDKNLVPINTDYDLYSMGPDGQSVAPLTAKASRDDIVRANDGAFFGLASDY